MGGYFATNTFAVWTFFWLLLCLVKTVLTNELDFPQELGLESVPDVTKINVSLNEYTRMMNIYLQRLEDTQEPDTIPKLITFNSERKSWRRKRDEGTRLYFPVRTSNEGVEVENAEVRLLVPPIPNKHSMRVRVYQVERARKKRILEEREVYLSQTGPKWTEFDVTSAVQSWLSGRQRNLGLELYCMDCAGELRPLEAGLSALVLPGAVRRKRNAHRYEEGGRTDCWGDNKPKCCRHELKVVFKTLGSQMSSIIQPKSYEAFFCKGRCPLNYNLATNHSRIQNLVHKLDRKATPRACCAPSKLESLQILRVHPYDASKLAVETWDNMKVLECACS